MGTFDKWGPLDCPSGPGSGGTPLRVVFCRGKVRDMKQNIVVFIIVIMMSIIPPYLQQPATANEINTPSKV